MNIKLLLCLFLLSVANSGCRLSDNLVRTTIVEPLQYARNVEERCERAKFHQLAECALAEAESRARAELDNYACDPFSADEKCGFIDGFVDYLDGGGTGAPPPLPPRRYWRAKYENPAGNCAVQDWYHGYAQGSAAAQNSGFRQMVLVWPSDAIASSRAPHYPNQRSCIDGAIEAEPDAQPTKDQPSRLVLRRTDELLGTPTSDGNSVNTTEQFVLGTEQPLSENETIVSGTKQPLSEPEPGLTESALPSTPPTSFAPAISPAFVEMPGPKGTQPSSEIRRMPAPEGLPAHRSITQTTEATPPWRLPPISNSVNNETTGLNVIAMPPAFRPPQVIGGHPSQAGSGH